jgi:hypothetical protein
LTKMSHALVKSCNPRPRTIVDQVSAPTSEEQAVLSLS